MAKHCIIGRNGFIGSALDKRLTNVSSYPTPNTEVLFYFGSTVHPAFEENPEYHMNKVIQDFLELLPYCKRHGIKFIFASSALVYEKDTVFTKCKRILELLAQCYPNTLALRIFPVYGPGERRTVISQWCDDMKKGKQPVVYGDGTQKRDFIYIDDVIEQVLLLVGMKAEGIADIGAGTPVSFNDIISTINTELGTSIEPIYKSAPIGYSEGIYCKLPLPVKTSLNEGIKNILGR